MSIAGVPDWVLPAIFTGVTLLAIYMAVNLARTGLHRRTLPTQARQVAEWLRIGAASGATVLQARVAARRAAAK